MGERENQRTVEKLFEAIRNKDPSGIDSLLHTGFMQEVHGTVPDDPIASVVPLRMLAVGDGVIADVAWDYGRDQARGISVFEFTDSRISKQTDYFGEPFETGPAEASEPALKDEETRGTVEHYWQALAQRDLETAYLLRHEEFVLEWPQSGERVKGRENLRAIEGAYDGSPEFVLRRLVGRGEFWITEATIGFEGQSSHVVSLIELKDGKISRQTDYFGDPFEAPEWRAKWVEKT